MLQQMDYSPTALTTQKFFKMVQNKLHFAIHGKTADMGLSTWKNSPRGCLLGLLLTSLLKKELADAGIKMENKKINDVLSGIREVYVLTPDKKAKNNFSAQKRLEWIEKGLNSSFFF